MPTVKEPSGGGNSSQSLGSPSIKLAWSSPNSASSRLATLRVSERTVLTSRLRSIGKKSLRASRLNPYETREDHLASIYRGSGAHLRVLTALPAHVSLTPRVADCRSVGSLVVLAMPAPHIPDAPDAAAGCTESGASGAGTPAAGPP